MNAKIKTLFYLRKSKVNAQGKMPIFQRITVNGKRFDTSTGYYIEESKWHADSSKIKGSTNETYLINNQLDKLRTSVFETEKRLFLNNQEVTFENFKNEHIGILEKSRMLIPIFQDHNNKIKELVGQEYAAGTLERYETSLKHTKEFLYWKYNISDINIEKIDHSFITEYEFYLRSVRKCANNTAVKYIKNFHKIINICLANGWLVKDPFSNYKSKVKEVIREFLNEKDIQDLMDKEFVSERLELVRDIFVFSCFTGLAYIDVKQLVNRQQKVY